MEMIFNELVVSGPLSFILTHKMSQDHLELFFGAVRSGLGSNNNPTVKQFIQRVKKLLAHSEIATLNRNGLSYCPQLLKLKSDYLLANKTQAVPKSLDIFDPHADNFFLDLVLFSPSNLSEYKKSVIIYIAGYVVKMMQNKIHCQQCLLALESSSVEPNKAEFGLLRKKAWGKLIVASPDVIEVCSQTEKILNFVQQKSKDQIFHEKSIVHKLTTSVLKKVFTSSQ